LVGRHTDLAEAIHRSSAHAQNQLPEAKLQFKVVTPVQPLPSDIQCNSEVQSGGAGNTSFVVDVRKVSGKFDFMRNTQIVSDSRNRPRKRRRVARAKPACSVSWID